MTPESPPDEPPIETPHAQHLEERALEILRDRARGDVELRVVERLTALRTEVTAAREAFDRRATARRHARGEVYAAAKVASINAMDARASFDVDL